MIDISLGGLTGAILGTVVSAFAYAPVAAAIERSLKARRTPEDGAVDRAELALMRRAVLTCDLLLFAGVGYWAGDAFERWLSA
jgi:hypothetical protein